MPPTVPPAAMIEHRRAVEAGEEFYVDPDTGYLVMTAPTLRRGAASAAGAVAGTAPTRSRNNDGRDAQTPSSPVAGYPSAPTWWSSTTFPGRVGEERLAVCTDGDGIPDLDAPPAEFPDHLVEVGYLNCEVLTEVGRHRSFDEMDLLGPEVDPGTGACDAEIRTVVSHFSPEHPGVERQRLLHIAHIDRDVVHRSGSMCTSLRTASERL